VSQPTWALKGPYRHGDGSFKATVYVVQPGGDGVNYVVARADIHVDNRTAGVALVEALQNVVGQLPQIELAH
jgi:hypothetical protein